MKINYNAQAIVANNKLKINDKKLSDSIRRLSSGLKIVQAKDNPSGLAMGRKMNAQIQGLSVANDSAKDGINIIKTADGVLAEIHDILQRMNELAVKASTDTLVETDRDFIQEEIRNLKEEIDRIAETADFNTQKLFDGTFDNKGYATIQGKSDLGLRVLTYSDNLKAGNYKFNGLEIKYDQQLKQLYDPTNSILGKNIDVIDENGNVLNYSVESFVGNSLTISDGKSDEITFQIDKDIQATDEIGLEITGKGAMSIQVGTQEGQLLDIKIPTVSINVLGLSNLDVTRMLSPTGEQLSSSEASKYCIDNIKNAISFISNIRSKLGAYQNRLEHTSTNIDSASENMTASYSQIMDVDMAEEMTTYSTQQVLSQAGVSILSQSNERASLALQLLQ